jgi:hypothetical protein
MFESELISYHYDYNHCKIITSARVQKQKQTIEEKSKILNPSFWRKSEKLLSISFRSLVEA